LRIQPLRIRNNFLSGSQILLHEVTIISVSWNEKSKRRFASRHPSFYPNPEWTQPDPIGNHHGYTTLINSLSVWYLFFACKTKQSKITGICHARSSNACVHKILFDIVLIWWEKKIVRSPKTYRYPTGSVADPVLFYPQDPGSKMLLSRIPGPTYFCIGRIQDPVLFYPPDPGWSNGRIRIRDKTSRICNTAYRYNIERQRYRYAVQNTGTLQIQITLDSFSSHLIICLFLGSCKLFSLM
jgi:hypothetical protein